MSQRPLNKRVRELGFDLARLEIRIGEDRVPRKRKILHDSLLNRLYKEEKKS